MARGLETEQIYRRESPLRRHGAWAEGKGRAGHGLEQGDRARDGEGPRGEGMKVAISSRSAADLEKARDKLAAETGSEVIAVPADMTVREDLERLVETTTKKLGGVDVLVYNTGPPKPGTFGDLTYADWEEATKLLLLSAVTLDPGGGPAHEGEEVGQAHLHHLAHAEATGSEPRPLEHREARDSGALKVALEGARASRDHLERDHPGLRPYGPDAAPSGGEGLQDRDERRRGLQGDGEEHPPGEIRRARGGRLARGLHREREGRLPERGDVHRSTAASSAPSSERARP